MSVLTLVSGNKPIDFNGNPALPTVTAAGGQNSDFSNGAVLDASSATLQVSDDGNSWRAMLRGDSGAAVTALSATGVPIVLASAFIRCTAGSATIRSLVRS